MERVRTPILFSVLSGCIWAGIAYILGAQWLGGHIWGGVLASPAIGVLAGVLSKRFARLSPLGRLLFSLLSLYGMVTLFGLAAGIIDTFAGGQGRERAYEIVAGTLWGVTFTGYFVILWPLAHVNHALIARLWQKSGALAG